MIEAAKLIFQDVDCPNLAFCMGSKRVGMASAMASPKRGAPRIHGLETQEEG